MAEELPRSGEPSDEKADHPSDECATVNYREVRKKKVGLVRDLGVDRQLRKKLDREWAEADGSLAVVHWVTETVRFPRGRRVVTISVKLAGADDLASLLEDKRDRKGHETVEAPRLGEGAFAYTEQISKWMGVAFEDGGRLVEVVYMPFEKTEATPEKLGQVVELAARAKERLEDLE